MAEGWQKVPLPAAGTGHFGRKIRRDKAGREPKAVRLEMAAGTKRKRGATDQSVAPRPFTGRAGQNVAHVRFVPSAITFCQFASA